MSYPGRENLVSLYIEYFEEYKSKFVDTAKSQHILNKLTFSSKNKDVYEAVYDMLLLKELNSNELLSYTESQDFVKEYFYAALFTMQADFARLLTKKTDYDKSLLSALIFAVERIVGTINDSAVESFEDSPNNIKIGSSGGFMIHENFFDAIKRLAQAGEQLEFLNLYNGVPIRTFSKSIFVDDESIIVELELTQILAMKEEGAAYIINSSYLNKNLKANILWSNTTTMKVALNNFETQPYMHALKRKYPRVHPDRFTKISLVHADGRVANGKLFDISQGGIGVVSTEDVGFKSGDKLTANIELKTDDEAIYLHLSFTLIVLIVYQNAYRYCLELEPNQKDTALIESFAKTREEQTIQELNALIEQYRS